MKEEEPEPEIYQEMVTDTGTTYSAVKKEDIFDYAHKITKVD
jgi:hypothetical protein